MMEGTPSPPFGPDPMSHAREHKSRTLAVGFLLLLLAFAPTLLSLHEVWTTRYTYSHGYLVPPLALWLVWRRRHRLLDPGPPGSWAKPGMLALGAVWFAAVVTNVQVIHQLAFLGVLALWPAAAAGWRTARAMAPAAVVMLFAIPFWEVLTRPLQLLTIAVTGSVVRLLRIDAEITGEFITVPSGTFEVAGSCAGLGFFIVGLLIGTVFAHVRLRSWRLRLTAVATGVGLAIVANWIRVSGLVVIGHATEMQWPYLEDHGTYGWIIFVVVFGLFFPIADRLARREQPATDGVPAVAEADRDGAPLVERVMGATAVAIAAPVLFFVVSLLPARAVRADAAIAAGAGWVQAPVADAPRPFEWVPAFPEPDERHEARWVSPPHVAHEVVYHYHSQSQGRELAGSASRIAPRRALGLDRPLWLSEQDRWVREAVVREGEEELVLVWYWYDVGGHRTVWAPMTKVLELWGFLRRRPDASLIAYATLCESELCGEEREAFRTLVPAN